MNKQLASLLFYNETLYKTPKSGNVVKDVGMSFDTNKTVVVLSAELSESETEFLEKVLHAVKLSLKEVAVHHGKTTLQELAALSSVTHVLSFGDYITSNNATNNSYKPITLGNKVFLSVDPIAVIIQNQDDEKTKLWHNLKAIFLT